MSTLCGNYDGPARSLPCHLETRPDGRHPGNHTTQPGNPRAHTWPNHDEADDD